MSIYVFLGPSLAKSEAQNTLEANYLPPAKMGDIYALVKNRPQAIVLIDGLFEQTPAIWHKEILYALDAGIPVFGSSSMGALRAAELHTYGMTGLGRIFNDYKDGVLEDDDEVAVVHNMSDDNFVCQSEAMVNIRYALLSAEKDNVISSALADELTKLAKNLFYPERSWEAVFFFARQQGLEKRAIDKLEDYIIRLNPNQKRDDAIHALKHVAALQRSLALTRHQPSFEFEHTVFWEHLESYFGREEVAGTSQISKERIRNHTRLFAENRDGVRQRALLLYFIEQECRRVGFALDDDREALQRFRYHRGLTDKHSMAAWLENSALSKDECIDLARIELLMVKMEQRYAQAIDNRLSTILKLDGVYQPTLSQIDEKWRVAEQLGSLHLTEEHVGSNEEVLDWYQQKFGQIHQQIDAYIAELGFSTKRQFLNELYAEYLYAKES